MIVFRIILILLLIIVPAYAGYNPNTVHYLTATTCSDTDVQPKVNDAVDGDHVYVPTGSCTWSIGVNIPVTKGITLTGAGQGLTNITDATTAGWYDSPFHFTSTVGKPFRVTGFTFNGLGTGNGIISIDGNCGNFRIDHCTFDNPGMGIYIGLGEMAYGVIDHCIFLQDSPPPATKGGVQIVASEAEWDNALTLGTANAVYIENSTFTYAYKNDSAIQAVAGAKYVFRYNTVAGTVVDAHGAESNGRRGTVSYEIYDNTFNALAGGNDSAFYIRSGTGVIFDNTLTGNWGSPSVFTNMRSCYYGYLGGIYNSRCDGGEAIDGNDLTTDGSGGQSGTATAVGTTVLTVAGATWVNDEWIDYYLYNTTDGVRSRITDNDGTTITTVNSLTWNVGDAYIITNGYMCIDQPGTSGSMNAQVSTPIYLWNNKDDGVPLAASEVRELASCVTQTVGAHIQLNREYIEDGTKKPGYTPYVYPHPLASTPVSTTTSSAPATTSVPPPIDPFAGEQAGDFK